jgi:hypothetical protein
MQWQALRLELLAVDLNYWQQELWCLQKQRSDVAEHGCSIWHDLVMVNKSQREPREHLPSSSGLKPEQYSVIVVVCSYSELGLNLHNVKRSRSVQSHASVTRHRPPPKKNLSCRTRSIKLAHLAYWFSYQASSPRIHGEFISTWADTPGILLPMTGRKDLMGKRPRPDASSVD